MHRWPSLQFCCPVRRSACASRTEPSGLIFRRVVSLHRRTGFRFCCPAGPFDLRLPTGLPASPSIAPSACAFGWISGSASRLLSGLRLLPTVPPHLPRCSSACAVSLASGSAFLPAYFQLAPNCGPFSFAFRSADRLAPSTELPALPSCLAARLAPCDRPFSLTFLLDCRFPGCLPPPALPSAFSSALASGSAAGPSFRFELPTLADCRLSGSSIR